MSRDIGTKGATNWERGNDEIDIKNIVKLERISRILGQKI